MEALIIFCAKYLFLSSLLVSGWFFLNQSKETKKVLAKFYLFTLPLTYGLGLTARSLWFNARPFVEKNIEPLIKHSADNGFPSDHTLLLAALAAGMFYFDKKIALVLWIITLIVGISRILAQVHHFADIFGSILIALISALIVYFVLEKQREV
jgi:undecaprenyl-diphosphatase